jgi:hypothetical protein
LAKYSGSHSLQGSDGMEVLSSDLLALVRLVKMSWWVMDKYGDNYPVECISLDC